MRCPDFLPSFRAVARPGEWVTCQMVARRISPNACGRKLTDLSKDVSRKLSNLQRYGHIKRRLRSDRSGYEYSWEPQNKATAGAFALHSWLSNPVLGS